MFIKSIRIENLRAYEDETIEFAPYTGLIGANGAGKSTILCALNIFFRETESASTNLSNLDREDFHRGNTDQPIEVTLMFQDLSEAAQADFEGYYRQGALIVTAKAEFDATSGVAVVKQFGNRLGLAAFKPYFKALGDGAKVADLQLIYVGLQEQIPALPTVKVKDAMTSALREYEEARPDECELIPSED